MNNAEMKELAERLEKVSGEKRARRASGCSPLVGPAELIEKES
jgi:hypothetical protein